MELRICDFRNAKFQGETINKQPAGFGFVLDQNYTFIAAQWIEGTFNGPLTAIFGDSTQLYGDPIGQKNGITVFCGPQYKFYRSGNRIIIDCIKAKYLIKLQEIQQNSRNISRQQPQEKHIITAERSYSHQNYSNILNQFLQRDHVPTKYLTYQNFLKETFKTKYKNLLNMYESSKQFSLTFRNEGIFIKLQKKIDCITSIGFVSSDRKAEIGRKYSYYRDYTGCSVQQFIETEPSTLIEFDLCNYNCKDKNALLAITTNIGSKSPYSQFEKSSNKTEKNLKIDKKENQGNKLDKNQQNRPSQCVRCLRQYYKRSLHFINKYMNLRAIYKLREDIQQIGKYVLTVNGGKYAQVQLEKNGYKIDQNNMPIITPENEVRPMQATLADLKKQLDKTGGRRGKNSSNVFDESNLYINSRKIADRSFTQNSPQRSFNMIRQTQINYTPKKRAEIDQPNLNPERYTNPRQNDRSMNKQRAIRYLDSESEDDRMRNAYINSDPPTKNSPNSTMRSKPSLGIDSRRKNPLQYKFRYTQGIEHNY